MSLNEIVTNDRQNHPLDEYSFEYQGYRCKVKYGPMGNWNGYVQLPPTHRDYAKTYCDLESEIDIHGGLTYSHEGEFGFDTAHGGDYMPHLAKYGLSLGTHYWTYEEVVNETKRLADQFARRSDPNYN